MGFWWFMLILNLIIPVTMLIAGYWMWKHCPDDINPVLGYRTRRSMKNMDTWKFAHEYCGRLWYIAGGVQILPTVAVQVQYTKSSANEIAVLSLVLVFVQLAVMLLTIIPVEKALKKKFNDDGTVR